MNRPRVIHVIKGTASRGTCKYCRKSVVWAKTAPHGNAMPFDHEPIYAGDVKSSSGVRFELWPSEDLHFRTCTNKPERTRTTAAPRLDGRFRSALERDK